MERNERIQEFILHHFITDTGLKVDFSSFLKFSYISAHKPYGSSPLTPMGCQLADRRRNTTQSKIGVITADL